MPDECKTSRIEQLEAEGFSIEMPECDASYILEYLFEIGICTGEHAITFAEIESWMSLTGADLQPFEAKFLKKLSSAYLSETHAARNPKAESVWDGLHYKMTSRYRNAMKQKNAVRRKQGLE